MMNGYQQHSTVPGSWTAPSNQDAHSQYYTPPEIVQRVNGVNGTMHNATNETPSRRRNARFRPPTVNEALAYTPLTHITPFSQDILPYPSPSSSTTPNLFLDDEARQRTRSQLKRLDGNTAAGAQVLAKLQKLLNGHNRTEFDFGSPTKLQRRHSPRKTSEIRRSAVNLSHFAKMALDLSAVQHRLPTPSESPQPTAAVQSPKRSNAQINGVKTPLSPKKSTKIFSEIRVSPPKNHATYEEVDVVESRSDKPRKEEDLEEVDLVKPANSITNSAPLSSVSNQLAPSSPRNQSKRANIANASHAPSAQPPRPLPDHYPQSKPTQSISKPQGQRALQAVAVVIPSPSQIRSPTQQIKHAPQVQVSKLAGPTIIVGGLPSSSQRSDYQDYTSVENKVNAGQKRKREVQDVGLSENVRIDQRQRTEEALRNLQSTIDDIVQMQMFLKTGNARVDTSFYFAQTPYNEDDTLVLTQQVQDQLESAIVRAIDAKVFGKIPLDDLVKVQKLCESTLSLIEALALGVDESASADDVDEWCQRVRLTENALHAARILLRILTAGREDKELYSESILETISECLELIMNRAIIPIVETRNGDALFKIYAANKKPLTSLFNMYGQTLRLLGELIAKVDVESVVYKVQDLSTKLIFVENAYVDKDSALGTSKFEKLRTRAMHVVAAIFHRYPSEHQRKNIFNEIFMSIEKLPVTRQSARQFKAHEGKSIQLVSALLMRLVQTSATRSSSIRKHVSSRDHDVQSSGEDDDTSAGAPSPQGRPQDGDMDVNDELEPGEAESDLRKLAQPLYNSAVQGASHVISYLVGRAQNTTKSGEEPYRKLFEIFVEDFVNVLGQPMWPGAELLLRCLLTKLLGLLNQDKADKTPVPAKNMALDIMGILGSGLIELRLSIDHAGRTGENRDSELTIKLIKIATELLENDDEHGVNKFRGPYRVMMEYLHSQSLNDVQALSARGLHLTQWAKTILHQLDREEEPAVAKDLPMQLRNMLLDSEWLTNEYNSIDNLGINASQARLASSIITIASPFGRSLPTILDQLVFFMGSAQSNLKSRSLKSITELISKDPAILDRNRSVIHGIVRGMQDPSPQVRDSALMLLEKCLVLRPTLADSQVYSKIIHLTSDDGKAVRRHAMRILKDIYLRSTDQNLQAHISTALMARVNDIEPNVKELAQQTFEELWMAPFYASARRDTIKREIELKNQVVLIVKTVQRGEEAVEVLDTLLQNVLSAESKTRDVNLDVCRDMVRLMFDEIIDNEERPDRPSQQHLAQALTVFAKAEPKLFTSNQLRLLLPYLQNLTTVEHLILYRFVAIIMRFVIPTLSNAERDLLQEIQSKLMAPIPKLQREELPEAAACLWTIHAILKNEKPVAVMRSALMQVDTRKEFDFTKEENGIALKHVKRYMEIAGFFGREFNFDEYAEVFKAKISWWKGTSVSSLIIDLFCPFTRQNHPQDLREAALNSIATVCQSWPQHYQRPDVSMAFELVFRNNNREFMQVVLSGFLLFFKQEERRSETGASIRVGEGATKGHERMQKSFIAGDSDAGATMIAQKFLPHILQVARSSTDELALTATKVVASINRQGLVHPKDCGPMLVVLETSTNKEIADTAYAEHLIQHQKHETVFDKEYMRAMHQTFEYQRDVINDPRGVTLQPTAPKLASLFHILKIGGPKFRKRFLGNFVSRIDFDLPKLDTKLAVPTPVLFARFALENLGFFEYARIDEILHLTYCLEKLVVHGVGTTVAHAVETEILKVQIPEPSQNNADSIQQLVDAANEQQSLIAPKAEISPERLRHLAVASAILSMVWETRTHLRQLWGLAKQFKSGTKAQPKDLSKPALKTPFYRSELLEKLEAIMTNLEDSTGHHNQCKIFAEIVSVDNEHRVASEDDDGEAELARQAAGYETPDEERETGSNPSSTGKGRKRKGSVGAAAAGTPSAKRKKNAMPSDGGVKKRGRPVGSTMDRRRSKTASASDDEY